MKAAESFDRPLEGRRQIHLRQIRCEGFARDDGLLDIEGTLIDTKPTPLQLASKLVEAGEPIHLMRLCLTVNREKTIVGADVRMEATPYPICRQIETSYRQVIGLKIEPGFTRHIKAMFRGIAGCSHLTELLPPMATTAFQMLWAEGFGGSDDADSGRRTSPLNGCHALRLDGEVVRIHFPHLIEKSTP